MAQADEVTKDTDLVFIKSNSFVWEYFGFRKDDKAKANPICSICDGTVLKSSGNTTGMALHLKRKHAIDGSKKQKSSFQL